MGSHQDLLSIILWADNELILRVLTPILLTKNLRAKNVMITQFGVVPVKLASRYGMAPFFIDLVNFMVA